MPKQQVKYGSFCSHSYQKSLTNKIELKCKRDDQLTHVISQMGKVCNKCAELLAKSLQTSEKCLVCSDSVLDYLKEKEICPHQNQQFDEVIITCKKNDIHYVPLKASVCKICLNKIMAAFNVSDTCKVCEGKETQILEAIQKNIVSPILTYVKNIIKYLANEKAQEQTFKKQLQHFCKAQPKTQYQSKLPKQLCYENDTITEHLSKRYSLYPKCTKHRNKPVQLCNKCLVAVLNLDCCPYSCQYKQPIIKSKAKAQDYIKVSQTGFLCFFPQPQQDSYYLDLFIIRQTEQKGRLDRWASSLKKIRPMDNLTEKFKNYFTLYSASVYIGNRTYLNCGGVIGSNIHNKDVTNISFLLKIQDDLKTFQIRETQMMKRGRASHGAVFHEAANRVYIVGGYSKNEGCLRSCQYYNITQNAWVQMGQLNIQRSKPSVFIYQNELFVMGGMTTNQNISQAYAQKYDQKSKSWAPLCYQGYDYPSLTGSVSLTNIPAFQNKEALFLLGGSNYQDYSAIIQSLELKAKSFELNYESYLTMCSPRCNPTLGLINEDIVIVFGGLKEHQSLMKIQAIKLRTIKDYVQPMFVYEQIQLGSYRLMLRQSAEHIYNKIYQNLLNQQVMSKGKLNQEDEKLLNSYNNHMLEKMHYTVGKNFVWVPM